MQIATSNPARFHLVITFNLFSADFSFHLCHDFSFWEAETGRCIPKEMSDGEGNVKPYPPLCNRTEFNCMDGWFHYYCPNQSIKLALKIRALILLAVRGSKI